MITEDDNMIISRITRGSFQRRQDVYFEDYKKLIATPTRRLFQRRQNMGAPDFEY